MNFENALRKEKVETFLAIAGIVGLSESESSGEAFVLPEGFERLTAFGPEIRLELASRARDLNLVPVERRRVWLALWHERLRRRGQTRRLDPNVHPEQIAEVLKDEPLAVRMIIESHLPDEIAEKVAIILQSTSLFSYVKTKARGSRPNLDPVMIAIVRNRFLANFAAFEDLFEPSEMEQFSTRELGNFIWSLGLREIAYVCRGISRKENLAGFLKQFDEDAAREVGILITTIGEVALERVKEAEERARVVFQAQKRSEDRIRGIGMELFAETLARSPEPVVRFNLQKLPLSIADILSERICVLRKRLNDPAADTLVEEVVNLAVNFRKGGFK